MDLAVRDRSERRTYIAIAAAVFLSYVLLNVAFGNHDLPAYDIYSYISFAQHYAEHWFHTRAPAVAHGLQIVSYPPLVFQVMALLSFLPLLDHVTIALLLISLGATTFSFAFYFLFRTLTGFDHDRAPLLILFIAFSPGLLKFVLVHGQLTLVIGSSVGVAAAALFKRVLDGKQEGVYLAAALTLTAYIHHFSFLIMALFIALLALIEWRKVVARIDYLLPIAIVSATLALIGLFPLVREMLFGISQGRIFHGSRNPFAAWDVFHQFITTTYGVTILGLLFLVRGRLKSLTFNLLTLAFLVIGLGLVTPHPKLLFSGFADFLTYDRFSLMASVLLAAAIGVHVIDPPRRIRRYVSGVRLVPALLALFIALNIGTTLFAGIVHHGVPTGYIRYNETKTQTAAEFLQENASEDYLYVTRGHWPPSDELRMRTDVPTLDTGYYPGRELGFLHSWGKFDRIPPSRFGVVLAHADNLSLNYVIAFNGNTDEVLDNAGWERTPLENGVSVWTNPGEVPEYDPDLGPPRPLFALMPGIVLLLSLAAIRSDRLRDRGEALLQRMTGLVTAGAGVVTGRAAPVWIVGLPVALAAPAFLTAGIYPAGIDTPAHIFKVEMLGQMIAQHGQVFRWTTMWYNGYPFMAMYPPVGTYLTYAVSLVTGDVPLAYNLVRLSALLLLAAAVHLLSMRAFDDRRVSLFAVTATVASYPIYNNLFTVGRFASALALPVYLVLLHVLLRDDILQREVSRGHILLALGSAVLFLTHALLAYLFIYTGLIFLVVHRDRIRDLGLRPVLVTAAIPLTLAAPYLLRLLRHSAITDPRWFVVPKPFAVLGHLTRDFTNALPHYAGVVTLTFLLVAIARYRKVRDRFLDVAALNAAFFYLLFWLRNYTDAPLIPFLAQFDQSRFEVLFTVFGVFVAAYGFRYVITEVLADIEPGRRHVFIVLVLLVAVIDVSPMVMQSANWTPSFADEMDDIPVNESYRAMGSGMRQWGSYILPSHDIANVFGWFNQANPNFLFTRSLQHTGGRWFGASSPPGTIEAESPELRKTLMRISNTKYVLAAKGQWIPGWQKQQVVGEIPMPAPKDVHLRYLLHNDSEYTSIYNSTSLEVFRLDREMSYCEGISPVWLEDAYMRRAVGLLMSSDTFSTFPVRGTAPDGTDDAAAIGATCRRPDPYTIEVAVEQPGWVLVKESIYPFWERQDGSAIRHALGFMAVHVENSTTLTYDPYTLTDALPG